MKIRAPGPSFAGLRFRRKRLDIQVNGFPVGTELSFVGRRSIFNGHNTSLWGYWQVETNDGRHPDPKMQGKSHRVKDFLLRH